MNALNNVDKSLLIKALEIAINSLEFDGEHNKAKDMANLIKDIKEIK